MAWVMGPEISIRRATASHHLPKLAPGAVHRGGSAELSDSASDSRPARPGRAVRAVEDGVGGGVSGDAGDAPAGVRAAAGEIQAAHRRRVVGEPGGESEAKALIEAHIELEWVAVQ